MRIADAVALALLAGYVAAFYLALAGTGSRVLPFIIPAPLVLAPLLIFRRATLTPAQSAAIGTSAVLAGALLMSFLIYGSWLIAAIIPGLALAGVICARYPATAICGVFVVAGAFGSLTAFFSFPSQKAVDLLLAGLWIAAIWGWTVGGRHRAAWVWPGVALLGAYVALSALEILASDPLIAGLQAFRASIWYIAAALLVAYAPWSDETRRRILPAAVVTIFAVGAYATLRWLIGPAGEEEAQAKLFANNFLDGELRPVGSFPTTKELAAWTALATPFATGIALTGHGRLRAIAAAAAALCVVGMLAADVRAGVAAAVPGVIAVVALYQVSQAFRGRRGPTVAIAVAVAVLGGAAAFTVTLGDSPDSGNRYEAILDPGSDASYQARLIKWNTAIDEIDEHPFGHGLGTAGRTQKRYGRFQSIGSVDVDNSYLKVAYEQGFAVMALLFAAMVALLLGLAQRILTSLDPVRTGPAIAACGTLTAMFVLFFAGDYIEGLPALAGWILVGLGLSAFTIGARPPADAQARQAPGGHRRFRHPSAETSDTPR